MCGGFSTVEKPPLHTYHLQTEVEAPEGHGGIWRQFYQPHIDVTAHITCKINEKMIYHGKLYSRQLNNPENTTICFTTFVCNYL